MKITQKQEMLTLCESMLKEIKLLRRSVKMDLPVSIAQEYITRICELVKDLETISEERKGKNQAKLN